MSEKKKSTSIGALWCREYITKDGEPKEVLSGYVELDGERMELMVYENEYKREDKHPDYRIYKGKRREEKQNPKEDVPF